MHPLLQPAIALDDEQHLLTCACRGQPEACDDETSHKVRLRRALCTAQPNER